MKIVTIFCIAAAMLLIIIKKEIPTMEDRIENCFMGILNKDTF